MNWMIFDEPKQLPKMQIDVVSWLDENLNPIISIGMGGLYTAFEDVNDPVYVNSMIENFIEAYEFKDRTYYEEKDGIGHFAENSFIDSEQKIDTILTIN